MAAILGLNIDELKILLKEKDKGVCEIANDNANGQVIISGEKSVDNFLNFIKKEKHKIYSS